jgi:hypothetical protein
VTGGLRRWKGTPLHGHGVCTVSRGDVVRDQGRAGKMEVDSATSTPCWHRAALGRAGPGSPGQTSGARCAATRRDFFRTPPTAHLGTASLTSHGPGPDPRAVTWSHGRRCHRTASPPFAPRPHGHVRVLAQDPVPEPRPLHAIPPSAIPPSRRQHVTVGHRVPSFQTEPRPLVPAPRPLHSSTRAFSPASRPLSSSPRPLVPTPRPSFRQQFPRAFTSLVPRPLGTRFLRPREHGYGGRPDTGAIPASSQVHPSHRLASARFREGLARAWAHSQLVLRGRPGDRTPPWRGPARQSAGDVVPEQGDKRGM